LHINSKSKYEISKQMLGCVYDFKILSNWLDAFLLHNQGVCNNDDDEDDDEKNWIVPTLFLSDGNIFLASYHNAFETKQNK
jgi:hypothetical protein